MSKISGVGPIHLGSDPALHMGAWNIEGTNEVVSDFDLIDNSKSNDYGAQSYSGSASGVSALEDTTGQDILMAAFTDKTKITDIKFYLAYSEVVDEKNVYWTPKAGSGGLLITSISEGKDGGSETSKISFNFTNDGLMEKKVETVV